MDILGLVKAQLTGAVIGKISNYLGESIISTTIALDEAMPAILGGIMQQAATRQGAGQLINLIKEGGHDGKILAGLADLLDNIEYASQISSIGNDLLKGIFDNKIMALTRAISNISGIFPGSAYALLGISAPILMGVIGKLVTTQEMSVMGMANMLMSQKDSVIKSLPPDMESILEVDKLEDFLTNSKHSTVTEIKEEEINESTSSLRLWMPWLIIGILVIGALYFWKSCQNSVDVVGIAQ